MLKVIKRADLSREEFALASFLQGSVNKKSDEKILIDVDIYLEYTDEEYEYCDLWDLVDVHKNSFDGLAVYDLLPDDISINMVATVCAVDNLLGVPRALVDRVNSLPVLSMQRTIQAVMQSVRRRCLSFTRTDSILKDWFTRL